MGKGYKVGYETTERPLFAEDGTVCYSAATEVNQFLKS